MKPPIDTGPPGNGTPPAANRGRKTTDQMPHRPYSTRKRSASQESEPFKRYFAELKEAVLVAHATSPNASDAEAEESAVQLVHSWRQRKVFVEYSGKANKRRQHNREEARERQRLYHQTLLGL